MVTAAVDGVSAILHSKMYQNCSSKVVSSNCLPPLYLLLQIYILGLLLSSVSCSEDRFYRSFVQYG